MDGRRARTLRAAGLVGAAILVAAGCAGSDGSDADANAEAEIDVAADLRPARVEVIEVAPPDPAAVSPVPVRDDRTDDGEFEDGEFDDGEFEDDAATTEPGPPPPPEIEVFGSFADDPTVAAFNAALDAFEEDVGAEITYVGSTSFSTEIGIAAASGTGPDIAIFSQPDTMFDLAAEGFLVPLPVEVAGAADLSWPAGLNDMFVDVNGVRYGLPVSLDMKSLVWYIPDRLAEVGEPVPTTLTEFRGLVERAAAAGNTPLCVGIESGAATGWVFSDWVEDFVLREHGPAVFDQWVDHEIPFDDERIVQSMQSVLDLWDGDRVFAASGTIAETSFLDNGVPLADGDCLMHRQATFFSNSLPAGTPVGDGSPGAVDVFMLPSDIGNPALVAASGAAALDDRPEVLAVLTHLNSAAFADELHRALDDEAAVRSVLSLASGQDLSLLSDIDRRIVEVALTADSYRYDGSDQMPLAVGVDTFWPVGTQMVSGELTAVEGAAVIEASWPA